jgi:hypothetical protein
MQFKSREDQKNSQGIILPAYLIKARDEVKTASSELYNAEKNSEYAKKQYKDLGIVRRISGFLIRWTEKGKDTRGLYKNWKAAHSISVLKEKAVKVARLEVDKCVTKHVNSVFPKISIFETYLTHLESGISILTNYRHCNAIADGMRNRLRNMPVSPPLAEYYSETRDHKYARYASNRADESSARTQLSRELDNFMPTLNRSIDAISSWRAIAPETLKQVLSKIDQLSAEIREDGNNVERLAQELCKASSAAVRQLNLGDPSPENWKRQRDALRKVIDSFKARVSE